MQFTKMHGAGNDFIIIDDRAEALSREQASALAAKICPRRTAAGADGMMLVRSSSRAHFSMLFYNSDGSEGEMCGNGARCLARYAYDKGIAPENMVFETASGLVGAERIDRLRYRVRLNPPTRREYGLSLGGVENCAYIELGQPGLPHVVKVLPPYEDLSPESLRPMALALRRAKELYKGANVNFACFSGDGSVRAITFERGVEDFTLACGTGCAAISTALYEHFKLPFESFRIGMPGGVLETELVAENGRVKEIYLTGPTAFVYEAELSADIL